MNFLERLALTPLFVVGKRLEGESANEPEFLPLEHVRMQMLDIWSHKGPGAKVPEWLASADTLRVHFEEVFGTLQDELLSRSDGAGEDEALILPGLPEEARPLAGIFEAPGGEISEILPPAAPFAPLNTDIPFAIG